jgi:protein SCO1/2
MHSLILNHLPGIGSLSRSILKYAMRLSIRLLGAGYRSQTFAIGAAVMIALPLGRLEARADAATNVNIYMVKGVFMESRAAGRTAVIAHERIPGYMEAMTMALNVKRPAELKGLQPGDQITFRLSVTKTDDWIDEIKKTGQTAAIRRSAMPPADSVQELQTGALLPDCVLTNQAGQAIHLSDFKGQALALTFFFSRCPLPTFCPRMNNNFAAAQQALRQDATRTNWQLLSISFDPSFDTPENLNDFARVHQSDPHHWSFGTSSPEEIRKLGGAFGLKFWRENGTFSHNLRTAIVDTSGRVQKVFSGNDWRPAELVTEMGKAMGTRP